MIRKTAKQLLLKTPIFFKKNIILMREGFWYLYCLIWEYFQTKKIHSLKATPKNKKRVLVYAIYGMRHAGTERNLQLVANSLSDNCKVLFMYGEEGLADREGVLDERIVKIPFTFTKNNASIPHLIYGMSLSLADVVKTLEIDVLITASPGYSHYPWNTIRDIPIVLLNIFGAPTLQKNVAKVIYNSETTRKHAEQWIGKDDRAEVKYAPLFKKPSSNYEELGINLRQKFNIGSNDFVFGRIGRDVDAIFDPIGIRAWQKIASDFPQVHYLIMSPPPVLVKIVEKEKIPRVHFIAPSSKEDAVWAFHAALDAMAHFRFDGETSGVAIAESLTIGNPIITHRSHIWNAHTEYLTNDFSRVVNKDDVTEYAKVMREFIQIKQEDNTKWLDMKEAAAAAGKKHFSPEEYNIFIRNLVNHL